ncbi:MAG: hypothetical protein CVV44_11160 [Spirochaetae bacterium HGW-Spirochaetae-1]|jgi:hypothetical protein|nr:MAG: hypothetical protein CVV44_11160 [Spirochaetae bacterium HGW-Spirochaetae-1]
MKRSSLLKFFLVAIIVCSFSAVFAQDMESDGTNMHDGFYLRFQLGVGYQSLTYEDFVPGSDMKFTGAAGNFTMQIGYAVINDLILFGELSSCVMTDPTLKLGGSSYDTNDTQVSVVGFGGGLSYYFASNFFLSLSLGATRATLEVSGSSGSSELGFGTNVAIGKEWWVSENWGLGLALVGNYSRMKDKGVDNKMSNIYIGLAFSATYN